METFSLDRLGDEIAELSAHLDAATAHLLDLIREFDTREGWNTGFRSCAAWLSWRVGLDLGAARERVRVPESPSASTLKMDSFISSVGATRLSCRSDAWGSQTTSHRWRCIWRRPIRHSGGSRR